MPLPQPGFEPNRRPVRGEVVDYHHSQRPESRTENRHIEEFPLGQDAQGAARQRKINGVKVRLMVGHHDEGSAVAQMLSPMDLDAGASAQQPAVTPQVQRPVQETARSPPSGICQESGRKDERCQAFAPHGQHRVRGYQCPLPREN